MVYYPSLSLTMRVHGDSPDSRTLGYSSHDIISTMFRVTKTIPTLSEHSKLEFIKEIGFTHMRILDGVQSLLQLSGCVAKLCKINMQPGLFKPSQA